MDVARDLALAGHDSGTVVVAEFQTAGRGRQQRSWFAPPGANVCMTVIGGPVAAADAWQIALVAGVAAAEAVGSSADVPVKVRFPNDLYLNAKKLGGILVETLPSDRRGYVIPLVGIGINANIPGDSFPEALTERATSLLAETCAEHSVADLTAAICARLSTNWNDFEQGALGDGILPKWRGRHLENNYRVFKLSGADVSCRVVDIAGDGTVSLETKSGARQAIHAAHVILGDD